jgi:hypothetical protein
MIEGWNGEKAFVETEEFAPNNTKDKGKGGK